MYLAACLFIQVIYFACLSMNSPKGKPKLGHGLCLFSLEAARLKAYTEKDIHPGFQLGGKGEVRWTTCGRGQNRFGFDPILVGIGDSPPMLGPILGVGLGCSLGVRDLDPWTYQFVVYSVDSGGPRWGISHFPAGAWSTMITWVSFWWWPQG